MTRLQALQKDRKAPDMPPPGTAGYLVGYLFEAGPLVANGMGGAPLGWADLQAWQASIGVRLQAWEARALRRLSGQYLAASQAAQDPNCPAPWPEQPSVEKRTRISNGLRQLFGFLRKH